MPESNAADLPFEEVAAMAQAAGLTIMPFEEEDDWHRVAFQGAYADVWMHPDRVYVFDINTASERMRMGDARGLLQRLKAAFGYVVTDSVLDTQPIAIAFWQRMVNEGIADEVETISLQAITASPRSGFNTSRG